MSNYIKNLRARTLVFLLVSIAIGGLVVNCTHEDEVLISKGPNISRGDQRVSLDNPSTVFDKTHCNVGWETLYLGNTAVLTGRFDTFGLNYFNFVENNKDSINFEAWVWLNRCNTSEPGRDKGCLLGTFGTALGQTTDVTNVAKITSKSVEYSSTDNGYVVKFDFTFHGITKELTGKLKYMGKTTTSSSATPPVVKEVTGFNFEFQFLAKTDFLITSNNIADLVTVKCNVIIRTTL